MQNEVQKWMIGLGFKKTEDGKEWYLQPNGYQKDVLLMYDDEATFFYQVTQRQVLEARLDELETIEAQSDCIQDGCGLDADLVRYNLLNHIKELEQQRQKGGEDSNG